MTATGPGHTERVTWLRLARTRGLGATGFVRAIAQYGSAEAALDDLLDIDLIAQQLSFGFDLTGELDLADAERAAGAGQVEPAEKEAEHLPEGIQTQAARHDRRTRARV